MSWHTTEIRYQDLARTMESIRSQGGTITSCRPRPDGVDVTWTTAGREDPLDAEQARHVA
jgi:hypothetical protein